MKIRSVFHSGLVGAAVLTCGAMAYGREGALAFIRKEHERLTTLLRQPASPSRDAQVDSALSSFVDYDEFARRAFGEPCPPARPSCTNHWATLTAKQRAEVTPLLKKLVMKAERKNVLKTIDYEVDYKGERESDAGSTVRMEARSKLKPRDPPLLIEYVVAARGESWHVIDMVTEGSSRTKNYYEQFNRMLSNPDQGYPHVVAKLKENIAKKDTDANASSKAKGSE
jgi:phospholipid transport system substrate-binding protein